MMMALTLYNEARAQRPILDDRGTPACRTAGGQDGLRRVGPRRIQRPSRDD